MICTKSRAYEGAVEIPDNQGLVFSQLWGLGDYHIQVGIRNFGGFYIADMAKLDKNKKPTPVRWDLNDMTGRLDGVDMWGIDWTPELIRRNRDTDIISPNIQYIRVAGRDITEHLRITQDYLKSGFLAARKLLQIFYKRETSTGSFRDLEDLTPQQRGNHPLTFMHPNSGPTHPISKLELDEELVQCLQRAAGWVDSEIDPKTHVIYYAKRE